MSLDVDEKLELERLLMIRERWKETIGPSMPALRPSAPLPEAAKSAKPVEALPGECEAQKGFLDRWCDKFCPGSDKPSGKALRKDSWMG